jgi:predicted amidophosphoribosyltransferase
VSTGRSATSQPCRCSEHRGAMPLWRLLGDDLCPGCEVPVENTGQGPRTPICAPCTVAIMVDPIVLESHGSLPRIVCAGPYEGALQRIIVAWKERGRADLTPVLVQRLQAALSVLTGDDTVALVPIPARRGAVRTRGVDVVLDAAQQLASERVLVAPALHHTQRSRDQAGLTASERAVNVQFTLAVRNSRHLVRALDGGRRIVIVDDVFTTGSTAREAVRALSAAGIATSGVVTMALARRQNRGTGAGDRVQGLARNRV